MGPTGIDRAATFTLLLGVVLTPLNTTMISVALVPIGDDLGVGPGAVMWLVVSLYLSGGVAQPLAGALVDRLGAPRVFVGGLGVVAFAGLLPLLVPEFVVTVLARVLLGFGLAVAYPSALAQVRHRASRQASGVPSATLAAISTAGLATAAIGPVVGGALVTAFGWAATFWVNTPLAALGAVLGAFLLRDDRSASAGRRAQGWRVDILGLTLFAIAMTGVITVLLSAHVPTLAFLLVSVIAAVGFVLWELKAAQPFIDVRLLARNGPLARTYLRLLLTYVGPYTVTYALSQWLQHGAGMTPLEAGFTLLPMAITAAIATLVVARSERIRASLLVAAAISLAGGISVALFTSDTPVWVIILCVAMFGVTHGLSAVSNQLALYRFAPTDMLGVSAGLSRTAGSMSALVTSACIALAFPTTPTDAGLHLMGFLVAGSSVLVLLLVMFDRSLGDEAAE